MFAVVSLPASREIVLVCSLVSALTSDRWAEPCLGSPGLPLGEFDLPLPGCRADVPSLRSFWRIDGSCAWAVPER